MNNKRYKREYFFINQRYVLVSLQKYFNIVKTAYKTNGIVTIDDLAIVNHLVTLIKGII